MQPTLSRMPVMPPRPKAEAERWDYETMGTRSRDRNLTGGMFDRATAGMAS